MCRGPVADVATIPNALVVCEMHSAERQMALGLCWAAERGTRHMAMQVRRGAKVRRHTTASKLGQPSPPQDSLYRDGRPQLNDML